LQAAVDAGVRRVVFASTVQTILSYPRQGTLDVTDPVRPVSIYGATKVFGEVLGRYYHDHHGLEFVGLRIGAFGNYSAKHLRDPWLRAVWLSPGDATRIIRCAVDRPGLKYVLAFATSRCDPEWLSLRTAREELGYEPAWPAG
jgi:NAD+ dependent glucose-6-phosphate dehydrogenase